MINEYLNGEPETSQSLNGEPELVSQKAITNTGTEAEPDPPTESFKNWKQVGDNIDDSLVMYQVTSSSPIYHALRRAGENRFVYYYIAEDPNDKQTNPINRGMLHQIAFNKALAGDFSMWTEWNNPPIPKNPNLAPPSPSLSAPATRSTSTFEQSNLDVLPMSAWNRVDVQRILVDYWNCYKYSVNGLLITEYDNAVFYYLDPSSNQWVEFIPERGENNFINSPLDTSLFDQTPSRLPNEEVQANRAAHNNNIVQYMVSLYHTDRNKYKEQYRHYSAQNPEFAKRISGAVLTSYQDEGKKAMLVTVIAVASPLILAGAIEAGVWAAANVTRESVYTLVKDLVIDEYITTSMINGIETLTGLPLSTLADIKDAKDFIKGAWVGFVNSPLFTKTIDDNFETIQEIAQRQKNGNQNGIGSFADDANVSAKSELTTELSKIQQDINQALQAKGIAEQDLILQIAKDKGIENETLIILKAQNFNPEGFVDFVKDMDEAKLKRLKGMAAAVNKNPKMAIKLSTEKAAPKPTPLFTNQLDPEIAALDTKLSQFFKHKKDRDLALSNLQLTGEQGKKLAAHIAAGKFEKSNGFDIFIVSISKTAKNEADLLHNTKVANQTFSKANELLDAHKDPSLLYFEYKGGADFDIDLGVKNTKTLDPMFEEVYQLKELRAKLDENVLTKAAKQLQNAPSVSKVVTINCDANTTIETIEGLSSKFEDSFYLYGITRFEIKLQTIDKPIIVLNGKIFK